MIHRAPHRYDGPFFILEKASRTVERDSANVYASSRVHRDPLEIGEDHNDACDVIPIILSSSSHRAASRLIQEKSLTRN